MKHIIYMLFILLTINSVISQEVFKVDTVNAAEYSYNPDLEVKKATSGILKHLGLKSNFLVLEADVKTAMAVIKNGQRVVLYNPNFINRMKRETPTYWGIVSVLSHEIGHHLLGHTIRQYDYSIKDELSADEFSGFVLSKMGASLDESCEAIKMYKNELDTTTHPSYNDRIKAITKGYNDSKKVSNSTLVFNGNINGEVSLLYKCKFIGEEDVYFIDEYDRVVWFDYSGNSLICGKKKESDISGYKWMFSFKEATYYVDNGGGVWNKSTHETVSEIGKIIEIKPN